MDSQPGVKNTLLSVSVGGLTSARLFAICSLAISLSLGHSNDTKAELIELKVIDKDGSETSKKSRKTPETNEESGISSPKTTTQCARNFHAALGQIKNGSMEDLNKAFKTASQRSPALPGKLVFASDWRSSQTDERRFMNQASSVVRQRGRSPQLANEAAAWTIRQIITDLRTYLSQPYRKFLCTGSRAFLDFISPHATKLAEQQARAQSAWKDYLPVVNAELLKAWNAMPPIPAPVWAPDRQALNLVEANIIRPSISQPLAENKELKIEISDDDLPALSQSMPPLSVATSTDIAEAIKSLLSRAQSGGYLELQEPERESTQPDSNEGKPARQNEAQMPEMIQLLADTRDKLNKSQLHYVDRTNPRALHSALAKLEILYYLLPVSDRRMSDLYAAMNNTLTEIDEAASANCTCNR